MGQGGPGHRHGAEEVGVHDRPQFGVWGLLDRPQHREAGIVDQHVDAAEPGDGGGHRGLGVVGLVYVEADGQHPFGGQGREFVQLVGASSGGHHVVTPGQGVLGEGAAEAGGGAGDEPGLGGGHGELQGYRLNAPAIWPPTHSSIRWRKSNWLFEEVHEWIANCSPTSQSYWRWPGEVASPPRRPNCA